MKGLLKNSWAQVCRTTLEQSLCSRSLQPRDWSRHRHWPSAVVDLELSKIKVLHKYLGWDEVLRRTTTYLEMKWLKARGVSRMALIISSDVARFAL